MIIIIIIIIINLGSFLLFILMSIL